MKPVLGSSPSPSGVSPSTSPARHASNAVSLPRSRPSQANCVGTRLPKIRRIGIIIGAPLDFTRFQGLEGDRFVLRSVTDELVYELRALSGQPYIDVYASSVREQRATPSG